MTSQSVALASEKQTYINQLSEHVGSEVILKGWLYNMRSSGKILFRSCATEPALSNVSP